MNKFRKAFIALLLPIPVAAQFTLSGNVKDQSNGQPLAFAGIGLRGTYIGVMSNADGSYRISNLQAGRYVLYAKLTGYAPFSDTVDISADLTKDIQLTPAVRVLDEVLVASTRAAEKSGMAYSELSKDQVEKENFGQDVPYALNQLPSVVTTSDAGAGVGYTGIRVRGSDGTRINVTINGVPVNDAESQGTYFVDMPDLLSSTDNIQLQRGAGSSTNGAGAFGASLNLQTSTLNEKAYGTITSGYGSFNTWRNTIGFGTGLLSNHWTFDGRLSKISSDGYIDRATSDLRSYFLSGGYYSKNTILKAIMFSGYEETYQAWYGVPETYIDTNRTYNPAGMYTDAQGNTRFYKNEVDHYLQDNYQLHFSQRLNDKWHFNSALHYTKGKGYYEEYEQGATLYDYNIEPPIIGTDTVTSSDLVRRKWLDNDFYGITWSLNYNSNKKINFTFGGAANQYTGSHFGRVMWAQFAGNSTIDWEYYRDDATKNDINAYTKIGYALTNKFNLFGDLQFRHVGYSFLGFDASFNNVQQEAQLNFFNPKAGLNYDLNDKQSVYASFSIANKEPNRDDYTQSTPGSRPQPETLYDYEAGWKLHARKVQAGINLYYMNYINQLVLTGQLNDVGAYNRTNVAKSYRAGVEFEAAWNICDKLNLSANTTFSSNKVKNFEEYIDNYDLGIQLKNTYAETDIAFSPAVTGATRLTYLPCKGCSIALSGKYVGKQYLDNTSNPDRALDAYFVSDLRIGYTYELKKMRSVGLSVQVNNLLNQLYSANGYTFSYIYGGQFTTENYLYPQAGTNFMTMLTLKF